MEIIVGYLFGVLYYKCMLCVLRIASSSSIHLQDKKKISLNYLYIVFGGNPCRRKNMFDSSMVNKPSGFEPLKFCCNVERDINTKSLLYPLQTVYMKVGYTVFTSVYGLWEGHLISTN